MLVNNFLEDSAKRAPSKTALVINGEGYTYGELNSLSSSLAGALAANGLTRGKRAVIFLENSLEAVLSVFAVLKAGGVFLMVNPTTKQDKLIYILNNCRAHTIIANSRKAQQIFGALEASAHLKNVFVCSEQDCGIVSGKKVFSMEEAFGSKALFGPAPAIDADLATIIYTSGSTGRPKGVMMSHLNMITAANSITEYIGNVESDVILNTLPLSFDYGLYQMLMAFKSCATLVLEKTFRYPYRLIELIRKESVTGLPIVPTISAILLQMDNLRNERLESLRYITNTAAALPTAHIRKLREIFPDVKLFSMYGLTECKRVSYLDPSQIDSRPTSVGKAIPNTEAYIVDEQGRRVGPGEVGELVVRGSHIMRGYWELPDETALRLKPGENGEPVLYTGDLFRMDEEGYLYFISRKDDIIKSRGEKVSPREIENVLYNLDSVFEAAVIGIPDPILGHSIKAFVVPKDGCTLSESDVLVHCSRHLEDYMVPKAVEIVAELPKTGTGKLKKTGLG